MSATHALCVDELTSRRPDDLGLAGESFEAQDWLALYEIGEEAREHIRESDTLKEVWVVSCDDVTPINLAAAIKADRPDLAVQLLDPGTNASLPERAAQARIDGVLSFSGFAQRYGAVKRQMVEMAPQPAPTVLVPELQAIPEPQALPFQAPAPAPVNGPGFLMPVISGSGGAGKSAVAALSALLACRMGYRTLLVDYDLQFGDMSAMVGIADPPALDLAISQPGYLEQKIESAQEFALIAAPAHIEDAESIAAAVPALLDRLLAQFDVVVANTGASWAEQHAALLERSSAALFLVDQRSSSVRACKHALELCSRCGIATSQFRFLLNRCAKGAPLSAMDVSCALQGAQVLELRDGGRDVEDYLAAGAASDLIDSGNDLCTSLQRVLSDVLPGAAQVQDKGGSQVPRNAGKKKGRHSARRKGWGR